MPTAAETETTLTFDFQYKVYRIWTTYQPHIRKFDSDDRARLIDRGEDWAQYEIDAADADLRKIFKRRMTDEQRAEMSVRLQNNPISPRHAESTGASDD